MSDVSVSDDALRVLTAVYEEGACDIYTLSAQTGRGPRQVQECVFELDRAQLVIVSEQGDRIECTPAGLDAARSAE